MSKARKLTQLTTTIEQAEFNGKESYRRFRGQCAMCPYDRQELKDAWWKGYHAAKNNRKAIAKPVNEDVPTFKPYIS